MGRLQCMQSSDQTQQNRKINLRVITGAEMPIQKLRLMCQLAKAFMPVLDYHQKREKMISEEKVNNY